MWAPDAAVGLATWDRGEAWELMTRVAGDTERFIFFLKAARASALFFPKAAIRERVFFERRD